MKKADVVSAIFNHQLPLVPRREKGIAFAPTNIALCKYWGKRNSDLNLPMTSSLSISIPDKGAFTTVHLHDAPHDHILLNGEEVSLDSKFAKRLVAYLDLYRPQNEWHLAVDTKMDIPVAAGLASSACGFAALVAAMNDLFAWSISLRELSILARLGSGSASRSLWPGFVEWHAGVQPDGMDSYAEPLSFEWPDLCIGILALSDKPKPISSREAMLRTVNTSMLYESWPKKVAHDLVIIKQSLHNRNFSLLGGTAESNALAMHATMLNSWPPICYFLPETIAAMHQIWALRRDGLPLYFTEDAGPNLKLLFLEKDVATVKEQFPTLDVIRLFIE